MLSCFITECIFLSFCFFPRCPKCEAIPLYDAEEQEFAQNCLEYVCGTDFFLFGRRGSAGRGVSWRFGFRRKLDENVLEMLSDVASRGAGVCPTHGHKKKPGGAHGAQWSSCGTSTTQ